MANTHMTSEERDTRIESLRVVELAISLSEFTQLLLISVQFGFRIAPMLVEEVKPMLVHVKEKLPLVRDRIRLELSGEDVTPETRVH